MQLVDYLNGMWYMICLPSLLCGLAVSVEDVRARRVPRAWIAVGCMAQIIVNIIYALSVHALFLALQSLLFAVLAAVPSVMGLGVGMFGLYAMVLWWLFIAVIGLLWIAFWTRFDPQRHTQYAGRTPFAPAIVVAGAISIAICALL